MAAKERKAQAIMSVLLPNIHVEPDLKASAFIGKWWAEYKHQHPNESRGVNGKVFETMIAASLARNGIVPLYLQARVTHIPAVNYDCIVYTTERGPISISAKASLRERWKQADLEALALKNIYRQALSYLVSMDATEVRRRRADASSVLALTEIVLACSPEYDSIVERIKEHTLILAPQLLTVTSNMIVTS